MLIELTFTFDTSTATPAAERRDMAEFVNYLLSNAGHRVAAQVADHFGYPCDVKITETKLD